MTRSIIVPGLLLGALALGAVASVQPSPVGSAQVGTSAGQIDVAAHQGDDREVAARRELDDLYKGDYRAAFVEKRPELLLQHIADDFTSVSVEGHAFDAAALRQFFPQMIQSIERTIEHNVTIENVDVVGDRISAVVTLTTVIEHRGATGRPYLVTTVGTYRDVFERRSGVLYEVEGNQLRNQTITAPRP